MNDNVMMKAVKRLAAPLLLVAVGSCGTVKAVKNLGGCWSARALNVGDEVRGDLIVYVGPGIAPTARPVKCDDEGLQVDLLSGDLRSFLDSSGKGSSLFGGYFYQLKMSGKIKSYKYNDDHKILILERIGHTQPLDEVPWPKPAR